MKPKIKIAGVTYEISQDLWNKIKSMKDQNLGEVRLNQKIFKLKDIELLSPTIVDELTDWSAIEQKDYVNYEEIPQEEKVVSDEKALSNQQEIKNKVRKMLKDKNKDWKPVVKDINQSVAVADVWEHLKSSIKTLEYPVIDNSWKDDLSINHHTEGKETHSVVYKTKIIDLGDKYDKYFWAEANYIYCDTCKKHTRKQIVIFNDYESECAVWNLV